MKSLQTNKLACKYTGKTIFPYADHGGCAFCAYASQFCICASFLQKTYFLQFRFELYNGNKNLSKNRIKSKDD
jgi:hypothetical protein